MGSNAVGSEADEQPEHEIILSPFQIGRYEISVSQYDSCVRSGACTPAHYDDGKCLTWSGRGFKKVTVPQSFRKSNYPVVCVTWHQAAAYCRSKGMKLPGEAQWEYAARAGSKNKYSWGDAAPSTDRCASDKKPEEIGNYEPNRWGLYDMTGNVWEWTNDYYDKDYYSSKEIQNPSGPDVGFYRVVRGGGYYSGPSQLRISNRHWFSPDFAELSLGFRCAR